MEGWGGATSDPQNFLTQILWIYFSPTRSHFCKVSKNFLLGPRFGSLHLNPGSVSGRTQVQPNCVGASTQTPRVDPGSGEGGRGCSPQAIPRRNIVERDKILTNDKNIWGQNFFPGVGRTGPPSLSSPPPPRDPPLMLRSAEKRADCRSVSSVGGQSDDRDSGST